MTSTTTRQHNAAVIACDVRVRGVVQGVGFRPFVARLAAEYGLSGEVGNDESQVFIIVEGRADAIREFTERLASDAPQLATVLDVSSEQIAPLDRRGFTIARSQHQLGERTLVPPDTALCADCMRELADPTDRRFGHPFITCTQCGPRFTIITDLPYDRPATTMRGFAMCPECDVEYHRVDDRRYHAQPIACHSCGPRLWWQESTNSPHLTDLQHIWSAAASAIEAGRIVAIKGIGGFHLACDASSPSAVATLRARKHRPEKPFAVMARNLEAVRRIAELPPGATEALTSAARPIVLLPRVDQHTTIDDGVAPQLDELGVMLPYAPIHYLLFERLADTDYLVMTSGNRADEPLCFENADALLRLGSIADGWLLHDRDIAVPCEDSVVAIEAGHEVPIRRSRGYAPLPLPTAAVDGPCVLAVGADVKNTFAVMRNGLIHASAHIGDMGTLETQAAFERSVAQLLALRGATPTAVVTDRHPGYFSAQWGEQFADIHKIPLRQVQHHHAHLVSLMADRNHLTGPVLGLTFDGTGYGCDRQVWGGEFLEIDDDLTRFTRRGHLRALSLPGGEVAVRNPFRIALALLNEIGDADRWRPDAVPDAELAVVRAQLKASHGLVSTTSMGRLFDGIAALLGIRQRVGYEAQAAIELEVAARRATRSVRLPLPTIDGVLDWHPLVAELISQRERGEDVDALALGFHHAIADASAAVAADIGVETVGLTGGVFANRVLRAALTQRLQRHGHRVLTHRQIPCNDGGIAVGQAIIGHALAIEASKEASPCA